MWQCLQTVRASNAKTLLMVEEALKTLKAEANYLAQLEFLLRDQLGEAHRKPEKYIILFDRVVEIPSDRPHQ